MGKIVRLFIFWLMALTFLSAASVHENQIKHFDKTFNGANQEKTLKLHHMLKNIYIQSIINADKELKKKALNRLVKTSTKLNLDATSYKKELKTLGVLMESPKKKVVKEKLIKLKKVPKKTKTVEKKDDANKRLTVMQVTPFEKGVKLTLNRALKKGELKYFRLKSKGVYRYVYDIKAMLMGESKRYKDKGLDEIRVAQYSKSVARVVLSHRSTLNVEYTKKDKVLKIFHTSKTTKKKSTPIMVSKKLPFNPKDKIIVIDAGHGGKDAGAVGYKKYREKNAVLKISLKLGRALQKRGYRIYYTRSRDKYINLRRRTKYANDKNADLFLSIHANAAPKKSRYNSMKGLETFFLSPARSKRSKNVAALENKSDVEEMDYFSKQTFLHFLNREKIIASNKMALDVQQGMLNSVRKKYKVKDGGVREAPFWVLVGAQMPSILIEVGYITNPTEAKRMVSSTYQNLLVEGIANGIDSYFYKNH